MPVAWCAVIVLGSLGCDAQDASHSPQGAQWSVVADDLSAALLSVWADEQEVFAVGADDGDGPLILHLHDGRWDRLDSGERGSLWWITDAPDGSLWMVGEGGLVLRYDRDDDSFTRIAAPSDRTLFGIDFVGPGEALMVGGAGSEDAADHPGGVVLRLRDGNITEDARVDAAWLEKRTVFKVWMPDAEHGYLVGERGLLLEFDSGAYRLRETPTADRLLTVHGASADAPLLVGGLNNATLIERHDGKWLDSSLELDEGFAPALNGVSSPTSELAIVVGNRGFIAERRAGGAWTLPVKQVTELHLHAVYVDPNGEAWAVGGNILSRALDRGVLLNLGTGSVPSP